ncbi:hypothetical protein QVD17_07998 [Tagetes erecta]|uniref:Uncharacterized protein n=1 Tax=Tagetes erecta TaxID=13708 RepID=A0AAD8P302_TARER|nr:hypothetical protein QVD17_07998 [Tagetes erecta]
MTAWVTIKQTVFKSSLLQFNFCIINHHHQSSSSSCHYNLTVCLQFSRSNPNFIFPKSSSNWVNCSITQ